MTTETMSMTATETAPAGTAALHGEIVSWELDGMRIRYSHLQEALELSGLDPKLARKMLPRNAFARASKRLTENRIIRRVSEDQESLRFQLTAEVNEGDRLRYDYESVLTLNKESGVITGDDPAMEAKARAAFDEEVQHRGTQDITALLQRLFRDKTRPGLDLIPINRRGTYFVRRDGKDFVDRVDGFLRRLNARLGRWPIAAGTESGDRSVRESTADYLRGLIGELDAEVEDFGKDKSERALKGAADRIRLAKFKVATYREYLGDEVGKLDDFLATVQTRLIARVAGVSEDEAAGGAEPQTPPPAGSPEPEPAAAAAAEDEVGF